MAETLKTTENPRPEQEKNPPSHEESVSQKETASSAPHGTLGRRRRSDDDVSHQRSNAVTASPMGTPQRAHNRPTRPISGIDKSADQSPLPHYKAKVGGKGNGVSSSPSWERKSSSDGLAPSTPGRTRHRSTPRSNETPDRSPHVPRFGEWNDKDPSSADGYTHIFEQVRRERQGGPGDALDSGTGSHLAGGRNQASAKNAKGCCCFPWGGN